MSKLSLENYFELFLSPEDSSDPFFLFSILLVFPRENFLASRNLEDGNEVSVVVRSQFI